MSIPQEKKNSNTKNGISVYKIGIIIIFVCMCVVSFAIGRITAFEEIKQPKEPIIFNNIKEIKL